MEGLPIAEAAQRMGISKVALRSRVARGSIKAFKGPDGQWRVVIPDDETALSHRPTALYGTDIGKGETDSLRVIEQREEIAFLRQRLAARDSEVQEIRGEMTAMRLGYERQVSELHVLLQTAQQNEQRLLNATVPDPAESRREDDEDESHAPEEKTPQGGAGEGYGASRSDEGEPLPRRRGWLARLFLGED